MSKVYADLAEHIDANRDIVVIEPSDLAMFRDDCEKLLSTESANRIADNSYEILEYVYGLLKNGANVDALRTATNGTQLAYHSHCQQRTLELETYTVSVLEELGYEVDTTNVECCGMAGSFGYKTEYYELSMDAGKRLKKTLPDGHVIASGTSCRDQLAALTGDRPNHPVELLDPYN